MPSYQDEHGPVPAGPAVDSAGLAQQTTGFAMPDGLVMTSNIGPAAGLDFQSNAAQERDERIAAGYAANGTVGGPFSREVPPPGMQFAGYNKGATGIVWKPAATTGLESTQTLESRSISAAGPMPASRPERVVAQVSPASREPATDGGPR
jgi:hypothetical protein